MSRLLDNLLLFGRVLRGAGVDVHPGRLIDVLDALPHLDLRSHDDVYYTCRALLVHRKEHIPVFDRAFAAFWRSHLAVEEAAPQDVESALGRTVTSEAAVAFVPIAADVGELGVDEPASTESRALWSDVGGITDKDFAGFTTEEIATARTALARLEWSPGERRTRRWARGRGPRLDLRRAIADSLRTGGEIVALPSRARRLHPRPLVLLCDVSGSMEQYTRLLLHFAHAVTARHHHVEAFLFATELTRITAQLHMRRPDAAVAAVSRAVRDWSGGTRIGSALKTFHQRWGRRVLNGGPVVLLISDGWDCGDPAELRDQIARLQRSCHRLIWLSPLAGTPGYEPLTRGLVAALPYVDDFLPARTLRNLADLAAHLNALANPVANSVSGFSRTVRRSA